MKVLTFGFNLRPPHMEQSQGCVVLIVTLQDGAQCTKNQIVSALRNLGEDVQDTSGECQKSDVDDALNSQD
jgi:hypothetical protein